MSSSFTSKSATEFAEENRIESIRRSTVRTTELLLSIAKSAASNGIITNRVKKQVTEIGQCIGNSVALGNISSREALDLVEELASCFNRGVKASKLVNVSNAAVAERELAKERRKDYVSPETAWRFYLDGKRIVDIARDCHRSRTQIDVKINKVCRKIKSRLVRYGTIDESEIRFLTPAKIRGLTLSVSSILEA